MPRRTLRIIAVGDLRTPHWRAAAAHYLERLHHWRSVQEHVVKDADASLSHDERLRLEGERLLRLVGPGDYLICLDERGASMSSQAFAAFLQKISEQAACSPCFMVGGPFGLADTVRSQASLVLSLGAMTLPHELARVVLLEQLYRAEAILRKNPYHH